MSGMADEMARRMEAEGGASLPGAGAGSAPGNEGEQQVTPLAPPAGESNAENAGGPPDAIPYPRFKEVNDRLAPYRELEEVGYGVDSLRRLASFEAQYLQDPVGTWMGVADSIELPPLVKAAIEAHKATEAAGASGPAGGTEVTPVPGAELSPEDKARLDYVDRLRAQEQERDNQAQLGRVVGAWDSMDQQDGFEVPAEHRDSYERMKLMSISATAANGRFNTVEELAAAARDPLLEYRNAVLGAAVQRTVHGESPAALPGGGPASAGPAKFKSLRDASKAAEAAILAGDLPPVLG